MSSQFLGLISLTLSYTWCTCYLQEHTFLLVYLTRPPHLSVFYLRKYHQYLFSHSSQRGHSGLPSLRRHNQTTRKSQGLYLQLWISESQHFLPLVMTTHRKPVLPLTWTAATTSDLVSLLPLLSPEVNPMQPGVSLSVNYTESFWLTIFQWFPTTFQLKSKSDVINQWRPLKQPPPNTSTVAY